MKNLRACTYNNLCYDEQHIRGSAMELLRPVFWGQGMFLQPQHFQRQDGYHAARIRRYLHSD